MDNQIKRWVFDLDESKPIQCLHSISSRPAAPLHMDMHYALEFGILLKGSSLRLHQNYSRELQPHDIWLAGIWEPHGSKQGDNYEALVLVLWPPFVARLQHPEIPGNNPWNMFQVPPDKRPERLPQSALHIPARLIELLDSPNPFDTVRTRLLVTELLLALQEGLPITESAQHTGDFSRISPAIDLALESNEPVSNQSAAAACGMSASGFIKHFKKLMGISFNRFSLRQRLQKTATALRDPEMPIKGIAREFGFTDPSHLNHQFKKHYGLTPRQYRLQYTRHI